jgi:hypothetical protein
VGRVQTQRRYQRVRRRQLRNKGGISHCYEAYREMRCSLQREIKIVKARARLGLVEAVKSDPYGSPYRSVMRKLRPSLRPCGNGGNEVGAAAGSH